MTWFLVVVILLGVFLTVNHEEKTEIKGSSNENQNVVFSKAVLSDNPDNKPNYSENTPVCSNEDYVFIDSGIMGWYGQPDCEIVGSLGAILEAKQFGDFASSTRVFVQALYGTFQLPHKITVVSGQGLVGYWDHNAPKSYITLAAVSIDVEPDTIFSKNLLIKIWVEPESAFYPERRKPILVARQQESGDFLINDAVYFDLLELTEGDEYVFVYEASESGAYAFFIEGK